MKPNFALFLSADGLRLSFLTATGWQAVGTADIDAADLAAQLEALRRRAEALSPEGLRCKLVLPSEQLRYLSFPAGNISRAACRSAAAEALDGATPYEIDDLAFDTTLRDGHCHVVAVARETLEEAESFAATHGFGPVCFVASPSSSRVSGWEPFFGQTTAATTAGWTIEQAAPNESVRTDMPPVQSPSDAVERPDAPVFSSRRDPAASAPDAGAQAFASLANAPARYSVAGFAEPAAAFRGKPHAGGARERAAQPEGADSAQRRRATTPISEAERLTVFGARGAEDPASGRSGNRRLVAASLVLMGLAAGAWSAGLLPQSLATLFDGEAAAHSEAPKAQFASPIELLATDKQLFAQPQQPLVEVEKVLPARATLTDEDSAVLDALASPLRPEPDTPMKPGPEVAEQTDLSQIWLQAPSLPETPVAIDLAQLYVSRTNPVETADAVARLPDVSAQSFDLALALPEVLNPENAPPAREEPDLVAPTPEGTISPGGVAVFSGPPPAAAPAAPAAVADPRFTGLSDVRPRGRPEPEAEAETGPETADAGPLRPELAAFRPRMRDTAAEESAGGATASLVPLDGTPAPSGGPEAAGAAFAGATERAVAQSLRPDARPGNFGQIVASSRSIASTAGTLGAASAPAAPVRTASVAPQRIAPKIPSSTSARQESTIKNAINLRKVNLIGVYGKPSDRRALVRLANGRYQKVQVGDSFDGGRISAIDDDELRYQKSGRNMVLKMPQG